MLFRSNLLLDVNNINLNNRDMDGFSVLDMMIDVGNLEMVKKIVDKGNFQLQTTEIDIFNPDHEKKSMMIQKFLDRLEDYSKQMEN